MNQYPLDHQETRAVGCKDGKPVAMGGIGCWGYNLCPSKAESQKFMLEYVREMLGAHPNADGLLVESSDYAHLLLSGLGGPRFFEKEFTFVRTRCPKRSGQGKPDATIIVYPHYFQRCRSASALASRPRSSRSTLAGHSSSRLHSAHLDPTLIRQARHSLWSDDSTALQAPPAGDQGGRQACEGRQGYRIRALCSRHLASSPRWLRRVRSWLQRVGDRFHSDSDGWEPGEPLL